MTTDRHKLTQNVQSLRSLLQPFNALVDTTSQILEALDTETAAVSLAKTEVDSLRRAIAHDVEILAQRQPELDKARALQRQVAALQDEVRTLESQRDALMNQMDAIRAVARQASAAVA